MEVLSPYSRIPSFSNPDTTSVSSCRFSSRVPESKLHGKYVDPRNSTQLQRVKGIQQQPIFLNDKVFTNYVSHLDTKLQSLHKGGKPKYSEVKSLLFKNVESFLKTNGLDHIKVPNHRSNVLINQMLQQVAKQLIADSNVSSQQAEQMMRKLEGMVQLGRVHLGQAAPETLTVFAQEDRNSATLATLNGTKSTSYSTVPFLNKLSQQYTHFSNEKYKNKLARFGGEGKKTSFCLKTEASRLNKTCKQIQAQEVKMHHVKFMNSNDVSFCGNEVLYKKGLVTVSLAKGNITNQKTQAIVNAANGFLCSSTDSGTSGAIYKAEGSSYANKCNSLLKNGQPFVPGEVVITSSQSFKGGYNHIIHGISTDSSGNGRNVKDYKGIEKLTFNTLKKIEQYNNQHPNNPIRSVTFPLFGAGVNGGSTRESARAVNAGVSRFIQNNPKTSIREIAINGYQKRDTNFIRETAPHKKTIKKPNIHKPKDHHIRHEPPIKHETTKLETKQKHDIKHETKWQIKENIPGQPLVCKVPRQFNLLKAGSNSACTVIDKTLVQRCTGKNFSTSEMQKEYVSDLKLGCKVYKDALSISKAKDKHVGFEDLIDRYTPLCNEIEKQFRENGLPDQNEDFHIQQMAPVSWNQPLNYMQQVVENKQQAMTFGITKPPHSFTLHVNYNEKSGKAGEVYLLDSHDNQLYAFKNMSSFKQFVSQDLGRFINEFLPGQFIDLGVGFDDVRAQQINMINICHKN